MRMCVCVSRARWGKNGRVTRRRGRRSGSSGVGRSSELPNPARARDLSAQFARQRAVGDARVGSRPVPRGRRRRRAGAGETRGGTPRARAGIGVRTHVEFLRSLADALLEVRLRLQELLLERRLRAGEEGVVGVHPARRAHAVRVERVLVRVRARAVVVLGAVRRAHLDDRGAEGAEPKARPARPQRVPRRRPKRATTFDETRVGHVRRALRARPSDDKRSPNKLVVENSAGFGIIPLPPARLRTPRRASPTFAPLPAGGSRSHAAEEEGQEGRGPSPDGGGAPRHGPGGGAQGTPSPARPFWGPAPRPIRPWPPPQRVGSEPSPENAAHARAHPLSLPRLPTRWSWRPRERSPSAARCSARNTRRRWRSTRSTRRKSTPNGSR